MTEQTENYGTLIDHITGETIGSATRAQRDAGLAAEVGDADGAFGIDRDGVPCPRDADPAVFGWIRSVYVQR